jgi:hypothetical protein
MEWWLCFVSVVDRLFRSFDFDFGKEFANSDLAVCANLIDWAICLAPWLRLNFRALHVRVGAIAQTIPVKLG